MPTVEPIDWPRRLDEIAATLRAALREGRDLGPVGAIDVMDLGYAAQRIRTLKQDRADLLATCEWALTLVEIEAKKPPKLGGTDWSHLTDTIRAAIARATGAAR